MSYHSDLKQRVIAKLSQLPTVNKVTLEKEYVNYRTKITVSCDSCGCLIRVLPVNLIKRGSTSCSICKRQKLSISNTKWNAPKWFQQRYASIQQRVCKPDSENYKNYGGRGIKLIFSTVDDMWQHMSSLDGCSQNLTIDRINNEGNYEEGNLRWANQLTQNNNRRINGGGVRQVNGSPRYQARISKNSREVYLGTFPTKQDAEKAVVEANTNKMRGYNNEY